MNASLIYLVAGEPSGDALGAGLMRALKAANPGVQFAGIGGEAMQAEGLVSLFPYRELSIMGFLEILPHIPQLLRRIKETVADVAAKKPSVIVTIDSPGFNFRLADALHIQQATRHIRRVHYVAPSVWAYKPQRARKTAALFDLLLTLLPFEPPYFEKEELKSVFVGHPVLWQEWDGDAGAFRRRHAIASDARILIILPGSRGGEIKKHIQIFMESAKALDGYVPVILAGSLVKERMKELVPQGTIIADISEKKDAFAAASLALSKSGTVTLELAAAGVPMVVSYKVNPLSAFLLRRMLLIKYASLVNIAVGKEIVPEYMQERCTPALLGEALKTLSQNDNRDAQLAACKEAIRVLRGENKIPPDTLAAVSVLEAIKA